MADVVTDAMEAVKADLEALGMTADVIHEPWVGQAGSEAEFGSPVVHPALVQQGNLRIEHPDGQVIAAKALVSFVGPIAANGAAGREEPIDPRDRFTLPGDRTLRPVEVPPVMLDPLTGAGYVEALWLA